MSATESDVDTKAEAAGEEGKDAALPLNLQVDIKKPSACERHVTVVVSGEDVGRYLDEAYSELAPKAEIPGFRAGKAPRKLVEARFRDTVADQVKGKLLMDSMTQISESHEFTAISEPNFDLEAVKLPDEGPLKFEFKIEVRPEFDLPNWKGMKLERPTHTFTEEQVKEQLERLLERYGTLTDGEGPVEAGHLVGVNVTTKHNGEVVGRASAENVPVRKTISFTDAKLDGFDQLITGKKVGDVVTSKAVISEGAENEGLRGKEVELEFEITAVKHRDLPELNAGFLDRIGGFEDEAELKSAVREELERQLSYQQQRQIRQQISALLTVSASWELPPDLLRRQARRELERSVLELKSAGFGEDAIRAHANELKQNILASTSRSLKEHFILERIAEDQTIEAEPSDYEREIEMIAAQSDESPRRVRSRLEKKGMMDSLRNQIVERKVIDLICLHAEFKDTPYDPPRHDTAAVTASVAGRSEAEIPEAKFGAGGDIPLEEKIGAKKA